MNNITGLTKAYITKAVDGEHRNENEYYPTPPIGTLTLIKNHDLPKNLWEPAAGRGHISLELIRNGFNVVSSDLFGYENSLVDIEENTDFLTADRKDVDGIITNPPFKSNLPEKLIKRMMVDHEYKFLALFCRLTFMESVRRFKLFKEFPPSNIYVFSGRINCHERYFETNHGLGGMVAYAWFVWDYRDGKPEQTVIEWVNPSDYTGDL